MATPKLPERYEILSELGSGGMGSVYKVKDKSLDKIFALKVLRLDCSSNPNNALRFQKEAKAAGNLHHENIMSVIDFGMTAESTPYMVLEYIEGQTLKDLLEDSGPLPIEEAVDVFAQVASALQCAHTQGVVHRDLKSHNILLSQNDEGHTTVKLFDFGIAQIAESTRAMALTAPNAIIGTPSYMSPEQAQGGKVDSRSDIYSLGCVMYETLTGQLPFASENALELLDKHVNAPAPNISLIVPELQGSVIEQAITKCLRKNPKDRFQNVRDILDTFAQFHEEASSAPHDVPVPATVSATRAATVRKSVFVACAIAPLMFIGITWAYKMTNHSSPDSKPHKVKGKRTADSALVATIDSFDPESNGEISWKDCLFKGKGKGSFRLDLKRNKTADAIIQRIPPGTTIESADVSDSGITDDGLENLGKFRTITSFRARGVTATARGIKALSNFEHLDFLILKDTLLNDEAFAELANIKGLRNLYVSGLNASRLKLLSKLEHLEGLYSDRVTLDNPSIKALSTIKSLTNFGLNYADLVAGADLSPLAQMKHLTAVSFKRTPTLWRNNNGDGIKAISKLSRLDGLTLSDNELPDQYVKYIGEMKNLRTLILDNNPITDKGFNSLKKLKNLETITLYSCPITKEQLQAFQSTHPGCKVNPDDPL